MTRHDDTIRMLHMLDHAREAAAMIQGKVRADLQRERMLELALVRLVEIIGEAASRVSVEGQAKYSSIPWAEIIGMRNRLIHGYEEIDPDILWNTIEHDLPPLIAELEKILEPQ